MSEVARAPKNSAPGVWGACEWIARIPAALDAGQPEAQRHNPAKRPNGQRPKG